MRIIRGRLPGRRELTLAPPPWGAGYIQAQTTWRTKSICPHREKKTGSTGRVRITWQATTGPGEMAQVPVVLLADVDEGAARGGVSLLRVSSGIP